MEKQRFPIKREKIKEKAKELFGDVETEDAYMYEGKEGVKVFLGPANEAGRKEDRIDILPHSLHVWYEFTEPVAEFCNWLLENVYLLKQEKTNPYLLVNTYFYLEFFLQIYNNLLQLQNHKTVFHSFYSILQPDLTPKKDQRQHHFFY